MTDWRHVLPTHWFDHLPLPLYPTRIVTRFCRSPVSIYAWKNGIHFTYKRTLFHIFGGEAGRSANETGIVWQFINTDFLVTKRGKENISTWAAVSSKSKDPSVTLGNSIRIRFITGNSCSRRKQDSLGFRLYYVFIAPFSTKSLKFKLFLWNKLESDSRNSPCLDINHNWWSSYNF